MSKGMVITLSPINQEVVMFPAITQFVRELTHGNDWLDNVCLVFTFVLDTAMGICYVVGMWAVFSHAVPVFLPTAPAHAQQLIAMLGAYGAMKSLK